jgi:glycosyltransferase involved in cell wall biosynthesis
MKHCNIVLVHYSKPDDTDYDWQKSSKDPIFNRSNILRRCLDSLKTNTDYPAELTVVDNGGNPDDSNYLLDKVREGLINTYIRNKNNMNFGFSWNMAKRMSSSTYLCLTCNDLYFKPGWLSKSIELFEKYNNGKTFVTPYISNDKKRSRYVTLLKDGTKVCPCAGSSCLIGTKAMFDDVGDFSTANKAGSYWHQGMIKKKYTVYAPPEDYVEDMGLLGGQNYNAVTVIKKVLMVGGEIDYTFENTEKNFY